MHSKNEEWFYSKNEETEGSPLEKEVLFKSVQFREGSPMGRESCRCVREADFTSFLKISFG